MRTSAQNHTLIEAATGVEGLNLAREQNPDLIILDVNLPGMSGLDVCRRLRAEGARVPIIMLTAKSDTIDVVVGLELGADDYVTKPFEVRELMARIGAHLRRSEISAQEQPRDRFEFPGLTIDLGRRQVFRDGEEVMLTLTEFNLLALLASRPGQVMSRGELLRRVWGYEVEIETRTVDAHVYRLRRKIEPDAEKPTYIHSVPGIGYRFSGDAPLRLHAQFRRTRGHPGRCSACPLARSRKQIVALLARAQIRCGPGDPLSVGCVDAIASPRFPNSSGAHVRQGTKTVRTPGVSGAVQADSTSDSGTDRR